MIARHSHVRAFVARRNNHGDLFDTGAQRLLDDDAQYRLFRAVAIDQGLQRQAALVRPGSRDHRFADFHERGSLAIMRHPAQNRSVAFARVGSSSKSIAWVAPQISR